MITQTIQITRRAYRSRISHRSHRSCRYCGSHRLYRPQKITQIIYTVPLNTTQRSGTNHLHCSLKVHLQRGTPGRKVTFVELVRPPRFLRKVRPKPSRAASTAPPVPTPASAFAGASSTTRRGNIYPQPEETLPKLCELPISARSVPRFLRRLHLSAHNEAHVRAFVIRGLSPGSARAVAVGRGDRGWRGGCMRGWVDEWVSQWVSERVGG